MSPRKLQLSRRDALHMLGGGVTALAAGCTPASPPAPPLPPAAVQSPEQSAVARGASGFEAARQALIWNARVPDRSPDLIVTARSTADVVAAVRHARDQRMRIAVRGSGHNYHAAPLRDGGLLLNMGSMKSMHIDAANRRASVEPGVAGGELIRALSPLGLSFPVGHCSDVGMSGYLLGGGIGWNYGTWGPACMNVAGIELVTSSGDILYVDAAHHEDLYWAARGAGRGFFAAVTRYDLNLHEMPRSIRSLLMTFDLQSLPVVSAWLESAIETVSPTVEVILALMAPEPGQQPVIFVGAFAMAESDTAASQSFGALRNPPSGGTLVGKVEERAATYDDLFMAGGFPAGSRMAGDMRYCTGSLPALMEKLRRQAGGVAHAPSFMMCAMWGRNAMPAAGANMAFAMLAPRLVGIYSFWNDPSQDEPQRGWVRTAIRAVEPFSRGTYISEADLAAAPDVASRCFTRAAWERLARLKRQHDPENRFHGYDSV